MRMSREEIKKQIAKLQKEIKKEQEFTKRWIFLAATINRYSKEIGREAPYRW